MSKHDREQTPRKTSRPRPTPPLAIMIVKLCLLVTTSPEGPTMAIKVAFVILEVVGSHMINETG